MIITKGSHPKDINNRMDAWTCYRLWPENIMLWWDWNETLVDPYESLTCDKYIEGE